MTSDVRSQPLVAVNPYEVLGLLPSAPQELVVEVYWHSVGRIRAEGVQDADSREALERLNDAYSFLSEGHGLLEISEPQDLVQEQKRGLLGRLIRRQPDRPTVAVDHWRNLTVAPSASGDVIDVAYAFWVRRTHSKLGGSTESAAGELRDAYEAIRTTIAPTESGERSAGSPAAEVVQSQEPPSAPQPDTTSASPALSKARDDQMTNRIRAALSRLAGRLRTAAWRLLKAWAADPLFEHDPSKPKEIRPRPKPVRDPRSLDSTKRLPVIIGRSGPIAASPKTNATTIAPVKAEPRPEQPLPSGPCLVAEDGRRLSIVSEVLTIGTDPQCDVVAELRPPDTGVVAAHLWAEDERVVLHVLEERPKVLVNGVAAVWAFLENGDELEIDGSGYRFEE